MDAPQSPRQERGGAGRLALALTGRRGGVEEQGCALAVDEQMLLQFISADVSVATAWGCTSTRAAYADGQAADAVLFRANI